MNKWTMLIAPTLCILFGMIFALYLESTKDAESQVIAPSPTTPVAHGGPAPAVPSLDVEAAEKQKQALELDLAQARRELTDLRMQAADKTAAPAATNAAPEPPELFMASLASMMGSPDMQEVMQVQARMALEQTHGEFVRGVDLDPNARDAFKDLLDDYRQTGAAIGPHFPLPKRDLERIGLVYDNGGYVAMMGAPSLSSPPDPILSQSGWSISPAATGLRIGDKSESGRLDSLRFSGNRKMPSPPCEGRPYPDGATGEEREANTKKRSTG